MKKISDQAQMTMVDLKLKDIQDAVNGHIAEMNKLLKQPQPNLQQILIDLNNNVGAMNRIITDKTREMKSMIIAPPPVTTTAPPPPAADDARDKHLGPRGKKQNPKLPDFWRRNFDYGESPYMHMDEIKTITDRPISKRKRKKKK